MAKSSKAASKNSSGAPKKAAKTPAIQPEVKETKPVGKPIDPNAEVNPEVQISLKFNHKFLKGASQEERIRAIADHLASQTPEWFLQNAYIKVACQNMREHEERKSVWSTGLGYPSRGDSK